MPPPRAIPPGSFMVLPGRWVRVPRSFEAIHLFTSGGSHHLYWKRPLWLGGMAPSGPSALPAPLLLAARTGEAAFSH
jgi:hypothetical protein